MGATRHVRAHGRSHQPSATCQRPNNGPTTCWSRHRSTNPCSPQIQSSSRCKRGTRWPVGRCDNRGCVATVGQNPVRSFALRWGGTYNVLVVNQRKHRPRVSINNKGAVELVRPDRRLLGCHRRVGRAELRRRTQVAEILSLGEIEAIGDVAGRGGETGDGRQGAEGEDKQGAHGVGTQWT